MSSTHETLEELLVDEEEVNEELLKSLLSQYLKIGRQSGSLIPNKEFEELNAQQKIAVTLLAQKARYELDLAETEWLSPSEINDLIGVNTGTIYPAVRDLADENIADDDDGSYRIPTHNLERIKSYIEE